MEINLLSECDWILSFSWNNIYIYIYREREREREMVDLVNPTRSEKISGKLNELKRRQRIQEQYFVFISKFSDEVILK